jgi:hypothetical protein
LIELAGPILPISRAVDAVHIVARSASNAAGGLRPEVIDPIRRALPELKYRSSGYHAGRADRG